MAAGDVSYTQTGSNAFRAVKLLDAVAAVNSPPSGASAGVPVFQVTGDTGTSWPNQPAGMSTIFVKGTGTDTVACSVRVWGYLAAAAAWFPVGAQGTDSTKGMLNGGASMGEVTADVVLHSEPFLYSGHYDRLYVELTAVSGTAPSFSAWLVTPRNFGG